MIKRFHFILVLLLCVITSPVSGEAKEPLTLDKSVEIALKNNLAIYSAKEDVKGAWLNKKSAFCEFLPKLSTTCSYTRLDEEPSVTIEGMGRVPMGSVEDYNFSVTLEERVYTGGALINTYNRAKLGVGIAKVREDQAKQDVVLRTKEAYFGVLEAEKLKELAEQAVRRIESHVRRAREFYNAEMIPKNDVLEAEVQLAQAKQYLIKADNRVNITKSHFNTVLRREISEEVKLEDILMYKPVSWELDESRCMVIAYRERPELKELDLIIEDAGKDVELKKSKYHPNVTLTGSYLKEREKPSVDDTERWKMMAVAKWTLWEWGKTVYQVRESRTRLARAKYAKAQNKDAVTLQVRESYLNIKEAEKNIVVAEKAIEQAEENFRISNERYKEHIGTSTEVLDAQTLLTEAKTNYYNALTRYNIARARLGRAIGVINLK